MTSLLAAAVCSLWVATSSAGPDLEWKPSWKRFSTGQYALLGGMTVGQGLLFFAIHPPKPVSTQGGILFDDAIRDALRAERHADRLVATHIADAIYIGMLVYPVIVDAVVVTWLVRDSPDAAMQMAMISLQSFLVTGLISVGTQKFIGRERPAGRACREDPNLDDPGCAIGVGNVSFIGGHVAMATTSAVLTCVHHSRMPIYGEPFDTAACVVGLGLAASVGVLRIVSDSHYATDILAGIVVGGLSGYFLPTLLHYGFEDSELAVSPLALPDGAGIALRFRM